MPEHPGSENLKQSLQALEENQQAFQSWGKVRWDMACVRQIGDPLVICNASIMDPVEQPGQADVSPDIFTGILDRRKGVNAILVTRQLYGSQLREEIPPILDDQAQLLGPSLKYIPSPTTGKILKGLRGRFAVVISNGQVICLGSNLEEAWIAAQLVEKTSKAFILAKRIGGAKSINRLEAWFMHKFYMLKYSRESERNR